MNINRIATVDFSGLLHRRRNGATNQTSNSSTLTLKPVPTADSYTRTARVHTASVTREKARADFRKYSRKATEALWMSRHLIQKGEEQRWNEFFDSDSRTFVSYEINDNYSLPSKIIQKDLNGKEIRIFDYTPLRKFMSNNSYQIQMVDENDKPFVVEVSMNDIEKITPNYTLQDRIDRKPAEVTYQVSISPDNHDYKVDAMLHGVKQFQFFSEIPLY